jgi:hypothetical protein
MLQLQAAMSPNLREQLFDLQSSWLALTILHAYQLPCAA